MSLNLASQPFVNSRPVRRLVLLLWCASALLIGACLFFYTRHFIGLQERGDRQQALSAAESEELGQLAELDGELAGFDRDWQNRQVEFLNQRITERVFPWSRLFDRLAEVLPPAVRLIRLRPQIRTLSGAQETVLLEITAEAQNEEALLALVNRLFEHPSFRDPNLSSETRRARSNVTEFALTAVYLPERPAVGGAGGGPADQPAADQPAAEQPAAGGSEP